MPRSLRIALLLAPSGLLMCVFLYGLIRLIGSSLLTDGQIDLSYYEAIFSRADYVAMLGRTLRIAAMTTVHVPTTTGWEKPSIWKPSTITTGNSAISAPVG